MAKKARKKTKAKKKTAKKSAKKKTTKKSAKKKTTKKSAKKKTTKKSAKKKTATKPARKSSRNKAVRERVVPAVVVKKVKGPVPESSWPTEKEWRQSGLCSEAQADGIPCTTLGRNCEICERADQKANHGG